MNELPAWPEDLLSGAEGCDEMQWLDESLTAAMARIGALAKALRYVCDDEGIDCYFDGERYVDIAELLAACDRKRQS